MAAGDARVSCRGEKGGGERAARRGGGPYASRGARERGGGNGGQGATAASGGSDSTVATEEEADRGAPLSGFSPFLNFFNSSNFGHLIEALK